MVIQYPHTLIATFLTGQSVQQPNGSFLQQDVTTTVIQPCRFQISSGYQFIESVAGQRIIVQGFVYASKDMDNLPVNAQIQVKNISQEEANYEVLETFDPVELTITQSMADANIASFPELKGKYYRLERRGVGPLKKSEFSYLTNGGFQVANKLKANETFFAFLQPTELPTDDINNAPLLINSTVKQFFVNQLHAKIWL